MRNPQTALFFLLLLLSACGPPSSPPSGASPPSPVVPIAPPPVVPTTRLEALLARLHIGEGDNVDDAVQAIEDLEREVEPSWLPELRFQLVHGGDFFIREAVARAVIKLDGLAALPLLLRAHHRGLVENHDNDGLDTDITSLIERDKKASYAALQPLLRDEEPGVRSASAWLLGYVAEVADFKEALVLASDVYPDVRASALGSLPSFPKNEEGFLILVKALDDPEEEVRIAAIWALGSYKDKRAVPLLEARLSSATEMTRHPLKSALEELGKAP